MEKQDKDTKEYEIGVLVRKEEDLPGVSALIREHEGEITGDFRAKRVALSYPIKKEKDAIFAFATFKAFGDGVKALEHDLNVRPDVLRSLIIIPPKVDPKDQVPREIPHKRAVAPHPAAQTAEPKKPQASWPLSNEALEKKIEEILK